MKTKSDHSEITDKISALVDRHRDMALLVGSAV
jgi:hypothetical protein